MMPLETLNRAGSAIALILLVILAYLTWALVNLQIPDSNENMLYALIGVVATQVTQIVGFFFGGSQSTKKQTETLDKAVTLAHAAQPAKPSTVRLDPGESATVEANQ